MLNPVYKEQSRSLYWIISPAATSCVLVLFTPFYSSLQFLILQTFLLKRAGVSVLDGGCLTGATVTGPKQT